MIGLYDFMMAFNRYQRRNLQKGDSKILWAGISTASNSGADILISDNDYANAIIGANEELHSHCEEGQDIDELIDWTSQQDWAQKGLKEFEEWLMSSGHPINSLFWS